MNVTKKNFSVKMSRANLDGLLEFAPPPGFKLCWFHPGYEAHWLRIHLAADEFNKITPELFQEQFGLTAERGLQPASPCGGQSGRKSALHKLTERQCYLVAPTGEVIGTGTAWFNDDFEGARWGRVHWMAILPAFQRRGLGKALLCAICHRLRELGHERVYLTTSTARLPAVKLYLKFGFEPLIRSDEDARLWQALIPLAKR